MSGTLSYAAALFALLSLAAVCLSRLGSLRRRRGGRLGLALATLVLALLFTSVKVDGLSAVGLFLSFSPSLSVFTLGLLLHNYVDEVFGLPVLQPGEVALWAGFVLLVSVPLFASVLGVLPVDLYAHGYWFSWVHALAVGFGMYAAWRGHTGLAAILLGALAAQYWRLLPSGNLFDALTDGVACFLALVIVLRCAGKGLSRRPWSGRHGRDATGGTAGGRSQRQCVGPAASPASRRNYSSTGA